MKSNKVKKNSGKVVNYFSEGFIAGQRKLACYLLELELKNVGDYQRLLSHLREVLEGREVVDNTAMGFTPLAIPNIDKVYDPRHI